MSFVPTLSPTTKYSVKVNNENKTISCPFLLLLIFPESVKDKTSTNIMQIF